LKNLKLVLAITLAALLLVARPVAAQSMLRDAETERFLRDITTPILEAAGLTPENVNIYLVYDNSLNAFVTGGQNIFIHTGLLLRTETVEQLQGVIAHETGHIAAGHLRRRDEGARGASRMSILSMVLGVAAIAAGSGDAGMGILAAGQGMAQRTYLKYNRGQESAADQAGASYLEASEISGRGLIEFFEILRYEELNRGIKQDEYVRSHPLNADRMNALQYTVDASPYVDTPTNPDWAARLKKVQGKLIGYVRTPQETFTTYPLSDTSIEARYARAYAYHRSLDWDKALAEIDAMISEDPLSPYYYEIKGQILVENHKVEQSIPVLKKAVEMAPKEPLILTAYGQALVASENPKHLAEARKVLEFATAVDRENTFGFYNLAIVYTNIGKQSLASLATAERYNVMGNARFAVMHANIALNGLKEYTPQWLRAQDILYINQAVAEKQEREEKKKRRRDERGLTFSSS